MGIELEITLTDRDELNFDKSLPHCNVKKKICPKASLNLTVDIILDMVLLDCKKIHHVRLISLTFTRVQLCTYNKAKVISEPSHLWHGNFSTGGT